MEGGALWGPGALFPPQRSRFLWVLLAVCGRGHVGPQKFPNLAFIVSGKNACIFLWNSGGVPILGPQIHSTRT